MPFDSRYVYVEGETASDTRVRPHNWAELKVLFQLFYSLYDNRRTPLCAKIAYTPRDTFRVWR